MTEIKAFGKWSTAGIEIKDPGLVDYIALTPKFVPRTGARYAKQKFHKSKTFIVERLMNKLMIPGHKGKKHKTTSYPCTGKASQAYALLEKTFGMIEAKTKQNPVKVFVEALVNAATREEIVTIEYGGARYPNAVECSPQRRIDLALRHMTQGAFSKSFNTKKSAAEALAEEIINAWHNSPNSNAIAKKLEIERQADTSR
jgi:small subunit ribosomal protein S7